jgi:predicted adenylyl cyclase CyaB
MAIEIELKARLEENEPVKQRLSSLGVFLHSYEKSDVYWDCAENILPYSVRVRREIRTLQDGTAETTTLVTFKTKEIVEGGVEVNEEREFYVSQAAVFEELLGGLGLKPGIKKEKRGWAWHVAKARPLILAELSNVKSLGWFIELEIMAEDRDEKTVVASRRQLLDVLAQLGIAPEQIEARPYSMLLREIRSVS